MLDDLRNSSQSRENESVPPDRRAIVDQIVSEIPKETFLGMTAPQRFIISVLILLVICVLGVFALLFTGSITLPTL